MKFRSIFLLLALVAVGSLQARERDKDFKKSTKSSLKALAEGCAAATSSADLSINNVRARILGSGDMWWDLNDAQYEVPKGSNKHSMFAGALWLGGVDQADQLRLAAMTYRQDGVDYWPGPLSDDNTASVSAEVCERYNKHWIVYREEVEIHREFLECQQDPNCDVDERFPDYSIPGSIAEWPGNGIDGELPNKLAPYFEPHDVGIPGFYEPRYDYPGYDLDGNLDCQQKEVDILYGDETIWWVYNDKGNVHTETEAAALGFEIRAQAFAFTSNDEVNNMTFNNYRIINRSTFTLTDTYFGTWFDPDLGNANDDIIGSDVARGLGYCYNADLNDEGANGYGLNPPAVGFDFFQGPFADYFDGLDNDRDGCIDGVRDSLNNCISEDPANGINERIIMSGFMYYNRGGSGGPPQTSDPDVAREFYNLLQSKWKGGNNLIIENPAGKGSIQNGDGFVASNTGVATKFAYPGESYDTTGAYEPSAPISWWESPNNEADKRGLHCAGPFSLRPGALNFITTGTVWARNFSGNDIFASVNDVIVADDKAQQLFDNCFQILDGPDSPDLEIIELDQKLVLHLQNAFNSNTVMYNQLDPSIPLPAGMSEAEALATGYGSYRFEGFQVFQVTGPNVNVEDLYDEQQSRLIWQSDIKNNVGQLINYEKDPDLLDGGLVPVDKTIIANNDGLELTFEVTEDAFAEGDKRLVNNREYYFFVIAYAQNQYIITDPLNLGEPSQKEPFLAGRNIGNGQKAYVGIPSKTENMNNGMVMNSSYGDGLPVTRLAGEGNSGNFLRVTDETRVRIAVQGADDRVAYLPGNGPINIKIADPTSVTAGTFTLVFTGVSPNDDWVIYGESGNEIARSSFPLSYLGEEVIEEIGVSVTIANVRNPGFDTTNARNNGLIGAEIVYEDPAVNWFSGVPDDDTYSPTNWILGGTANIAATDEVGHFYNSVDGDPLGVFQGILGGIVAPFRLTSDVVYDPFPADPPLEGYGIRPSVPNNNVTPLEELPNVDLVITKNPELWTRVPVFELGNDPVQNEGNKQRFELRSDVTTKIEGGELVPDNSRTDHQTGWSWFPGYAIDVETGKRLHMAFGESSWLKGSYGGDLLWNPSADMFDKLNTRYELGGMHVIYIFNDEAEVFGTSGSLETRDMAYTSDDINDHPLIDLFSNYTINNRNQIFQSIAWAAFPLVDDEKYEFTKYSDIPTDMRMSLRVDNRYGRTEADDANDGYPVYNFNTMGLETETNVTSVANEALENIKVVPNPYYGYSEYESSQLENVVRITNLPETCTISIFMTNGTLVRTINKSTSSRTFAEWDLKNDFNVPIASGIYLIHIDAGEIGQKVVKWMGSLPPVDLNAF